MKTSDPNINYSTNPRTVIWTNIIVVFLYNMLKDVYPIPIVSDTFLTDWPLLRSSVLRVLLFQFTTYILLNILYGRVIMVYKIINYQSVFFSRVPIFLQSNTCLSRKSDFKKVTVLVTLEVPRLTGRGWFAILIEESFITKLFWKPY